MADAADLKSSFRLLTWCYQAILSSIYRRCGRQSKVTSCLVSLGNWLIFGSSMVTSPHLFTKVTRLLHSLHNIAINRCKDKKELPRTRVSVTVVESHNEALAD